MYHEYHRNLLKIIKDISILHHLKFFIILKNKILKKNNFIFIKYQNKKFIYFNIKIQIKYSYFLISFFICVNLHN